MLYSVSTFPCMTVSLALDGAGLGAMWGEQKAGEMFREAGLTSVETKRVPEESSICTPSAGTTMTAQRTPTAPSPDE